MKKIYFFCCITVLILQSCLNVQELEKVCISLPAKPILTQQADTLYFAPGQTIYISVSNYAYETGYTYTWKGPNNLYKESSNGALSIQASSGIQSGTYTVTRRNTQSGCTTEGTSIVVIVQAIANSCGMFDNTFTPGGGNTIQTFPSATIITNSNYYFARFENSLTGDYVTLRFGLAPGTGTTTYDIFDVSDPQLLGNNESEISCSIDGIAYGAISGTIKTTYANGKYKAEFCNVLLKRVGVSTYYSDCKGNLTFQ